VCPFYGRRRRRIAVPTSSSFEKLVFVLAFAVVVLGLVPVVDAQSLPTGWSLTDIGGPPAAGTATQSNGAFSVTSRGYDVSGTADQFTYISKAVTGDVTIEAKVDTLQNTDAWSIAGLVLRQSTSAGAREVSVFVTPSKGLVVRGRSASGGGTVQMTVGSGTAPVWLRLVRKYKTVTAYRSADGVTWKSLASITLPLNKTVLVGLALASHSKTARVAASFSKLSINGIPVVVSAPSSGVNVPPSVSLNSPAGGTSYGAPATIAIGATAADSDGSIARIDFYAGSTKVGSDSTSPYTFSWGSVPIGSYVLKAVATDNAGATTTSSTVTVTVSSNKPPLVSLTSPVDNAIFPLLSTIAVTATASDPDGSIARVDFYNGSTLLGSDTTSPYSFTWLSVGLGTYSLSAVARDNLGASTVSSWVDIGVGSTTTLSKAVFKPAVVPEGVQYYVFEVFAAGANPNTAAPIATQNLGVPAVVSGECSADVKSTILGLSAGNYIATVSSVSTDGKLRSNSYSFTR